MTKKYPAKDGKLFNSKEERDAYELQPKRQEQPVINTWRYDH